MSSREQKGHPGFLKRILGPAVLWHEEYRHNAFVGTLWEIYLLTQVSANENTEEMKPLCAFRDEPHSSVQTMSQGRSQPSVWVQFKGKIKVITLPWISGQE